MTYTSCSTCGALSAPWSAGHRPGCESYRPPKSARLCPVCGHPMGVTYVRVAEPSHGVAGRGHPAEVQFACRRGCDVSWIETTEADDDTDDDTDDEEPADSLVRPGPLTPPQSPIYLPPFPHPHLDRSTSR